MNQRLVDIKEELEAKELQAKIASVQEFWGENDAALELLCDAMDELEKQASEGAFGEAGLSPSQILSLGVRYTEQALTELAKEAELEEDMEKEAEEAEEIDEELLAEMQEKYALAYDLGQTLGVAGITSDDIEKLAEASDEEADDFCRLLSHLTALEIENDED